MRILVMFIMISCAGHRVKPEVETNISKEIGLCDKEYETKNSYFACMRGVIFNVNNLKELNLKDYKEINKEYFSKLDQKSWKHEMELFINSISSLMRLDDEYAYIMNTIGCNEKRDDRKPIALNLVDYSFLHKLMEQDRGKAYHYICGIKAETSDDIISKGILIGSVFTGLDQMRNQADSEKKEIKKVASLENIDKRLDPDMIAQIKEISIKALKDKSLENKHRSTLKKLNVYLINSANLNPEKIESLSLALYAAGKKKTKFKDILMLENLMLNELSIKLTSFLFLNRIENYEEFYGNQKLQKFFQMLEASGYKEASETLNKWKENSDQEAEKV